MQEERDENCFKGIKANKNNTEKQKVKTIEKQKFKSKKC